jgi:AraC family ethanolamine operon transcriptional activator
VSAAAGTLGESAVTGFGGSEPAPCSMAHIVSSDIDEQAASLRQWDQVYEQLTPGRFAGSLREVSFRGVQIFRETTNQSVHEAGTTRPGSRAIGVPLQMAGTALFGGEVVHVDALITLSGDDELDFYAPKGFDVLGLAVDEQVLAAYAASIEHRDIAKLFGGKHVLMPPVGPLTDFRRLLLSMLASLDANPEALRFGQTQRMLEQSVLAGILAVTEEMDETSPKPPCESRLRVVDRARTYMGAHIDLPITVADLCLELGVSRRTLQYSFQEVLGLNPVRFLRALRLNGVRRDLRSGRRSAESVQGVAAKWGFWHLGHFVTDYKRMFGELPSETLRGHARSALAN